MTNTDTWTDLAYFFRTWLSDPLRVAAIAPSGKALARIMTQEIRPNTGPVLELGPGTGVFTRALLEKGVHESDLTLIEFGAEFRDILEKRFPQSRVLLMDAAELAQKVTDILSGAFHYLQSDGAFYQFTYGPRCPVPQRILDRLELKATHIGRAVCNLPPAAVYRITRH